MKRWALLVAALYVVALVLVTLPGVLLAMGPQVNLPQAAEVYAKWPYWAWLGIMGTCQFALLLVPVRVASRRPVNRGALWPTLAAGGLMAGCLVAGAGYSLLEFFTKGESIKPFVGMLPITLGLCIWCVWALFFAYMHRQAERPNWTSRQCQLLLRGSVLELLIAVPTHIVARSRGYCCAGIMTFIGITAGISIMLFSFGPAVFFLYAARWQRLHPADPERVQSDV